MISNKPKQSLLKRKAPRQKRARLTLQKILAAAEQVLIRDGFDSITTRRIAEVAGVSVGSIYEYFPSVQAILYQIYEKRLQELLGLIDRAFGEDNLQASLIDTFLAYLQMQREAKFPGRVDLELRNAIDRDRKLAEMTEYYETELSKRYVSIWKHYGSVWSTRHLLLLAEFAHELDHMNLKLQKEHTREDRRFIGDVTTHQFTALARYCGALRDQD